MKLLNIKFLLLFLTTIVMWSCKKEDLTSKNDESGKDKIEFRSSQQVTLAWLQTFQSDLSLAINGNTPLNTYDIQDAVKGVEALIAVGVSTNHDERIHKMKTTLLQIDTSINDTLLVQLFSQSFNAFEQHYTSLDTSETERVTIDISLDSTIGATAYISVYSVMGVTNQCVDTTYSHRCTEIFDGKEFIMGGGDEEDEIYDWFTNLDCPGCETPSGCGTGPKTGPEEIENALNFNIEKPISPNPAKPYLQGVRGC